MQDFKNYYQKVADKDQHIAEGFRLFRESAQILEAYINGAVALDDATLLNIVKGMCEMHSRLEDLSDA